MSFMVMIIRVELKFGQDNGGGGGGDGDGNGENLGQHNLDKGIFLLVYLSSSSSSSLSAGESRFSEKKKLEKLNSLDDDMIDV